MKYVYTAKHPIFEGRRITPGAGVPAFKAAEIARLLRAGVIEKYRPDESPKKIEKKSGGEN
jgi:hypothetical protein